MENLKIGNICHSLNSKNRGFITLIKKNICVISIYFPFTQLVAVKREEIAELFLITDKKTTLKYDSIISDFDGLGV